jgi:hypothetical protein
MTILEALKKTTESIMKWVNDKIAHDFSDTSADNIPSVNAVKTYVQKEINEAQFSGSSVQANWDQADETAADYIKNRPFYSMMAHEIVPLQEAVFNTPIGYPDGYVVANLPVSKTFPIIPDVPYSFTFDGVITQVVGTYMDGFVAFGNLSVEGAGDDTGEPYLLGCVYSDGDPSDPRFVVYYKTTEGTHTVGFSYTEEIIPIVANNQYAFINNKGYIYYIWDEFIGIHLQDNEKYKFTLNNEIYEITPLYDEDFSKTAYFAGNPRIIDENYPDTGEKYLLMFTFDQIEAYLSADLFDAGDYTIAIEKIVQQNSTEIIYKIDEKYLPEKATIINENSTDRQHVTAKAVYDYVKLENLNPAWDTTLVFDGGDADVQVAILDKTILL